MRLPRGEEGGKKKGKEVRRSERGSLGLLGARLGSVPLLAV